MKRIIMSPQFPRLLLVAAVFLVPVILIPLSTVPFQFTKYLLFALVLVVALAFLIIDWIRTGAVRLPDAWMTLAVFSLPLAYLIAALFADNTALAVIGNGADVDTFMSYFLFAIAFALGSYFFADRKGVMLLYGALGATFAVLALFQIARVAFGSALAIGPFASVTTNLLGKWNDLGLLAGLIAVLSMMGLSLIARRGRAGIIWWVLLALALTVAALVNLPLVWWLLLIGSFALIIGTLLTRMRGNDGEERKLSMPPAPSLVVLAVSLIFLIGGSTLGTVIGETFSIGHVEARPSWGSTSAVMSEVYTSGEVFGMGPNHFSRAWNLYKPQPVNQTIFWNSDFASGVSTVATSLVTVGILGILAWAAFFTLFAMRFYQYARGEEYSGGDRFLVFSLFAGSTYLLAALLFYVPGITLLLLTFLLVGSSVGFATVAAGKKIWTLSFFGNTRLGFIALAGLVLVLIGSVALFAGSSTRYAVAMMLQQASTQLQVEGDIVSAAGTIESAIAIGGRAQEYRAGAEIGLTLMQTLINEIGDREVTDQDRSQFQSILSQTVAYGVRATEADPTNYLNWTTLGSIYESLMPFGIQGAYENAQRAYERAAELSPQHPGVSLALARLELAQGNNDAVRGFITQALQKKQNYTEAIFLLSQLEISEGDLDAAVASVEAAAVINPTNPVVFFQLGFLRYANEDYEGAAQALEQALSLNENYANARYFLGLAYYQLGRSAESVNQFEALAQTNQENQEIALILENLREGRPPLTGVVPDTPPEERETLPIEE